MARCFKSDVSKADNFSITLELVPGRGFNGGGLDAIVEITRDAAQDGRIGAISITDNPGGNPSLSPDVLGKELLETGLDVIVHCTCRDTNRVGLESRALQLARMGLTNVLAISGDHPPIGAPVFDLDSVSLITMLKEMNTRLATQGKLETFFSGCAISPFKYTEAESIIQYQKLVLKVEAGAKFAITQLGYDVDKYVELLEFKKQNNINIPIIASLYHLNQGTTKFMYQGKVPGVCISTKLFNTIIGEYEQKGGGQSTAVERSARLGAVLKGIGYNGIHIGGIHKSFDTVRKTLDRMDEIGDNWQEYLNDFKKMEPTGFYLLPEKVVENEQGKIRPDPVKVNVLESCHYLGMKYAHRLFFDKSSQLAPLCKKLSSTLDQKKIPWLVKYFLENPLKKVLLSCQECGDCAIQHVGFLCPESGCAKRCRNGPCGGSKNGYCEVYPEKLCVWVRAYHRLKKHEETSTIPATFVPPRIWALRKSSSWINFHLDRDHQGEKK